jgi:hydroxymethylpyrimidine pyrophosphatase-like HAD family hydrolase
VNTIVFTDLDDTLFQTQRKISDTVGLVPVTLDRDGVPHSFHSQSQQRLLKWLDTATLIPVTGRNPQAFARVQMRFDSWAVLDHGATLLEPGGAPSHAWRERILALLEPQQIALQEAVKIADGLNSAHGFGCEIRTDLAHGIPFMVVIKHPQRDTNALQALAKPWRDQTKSLGLWFFANDNNLSLIAAGVNKEQAVAWLLEHLQPDLSFGCGDSIADVPFMNKCDFVISPQQSQWLRASLEANLEQH